MPRDNLDTQAARPGTVGHVIGRHTSYVDGLSLAPALRQADVMGTRPSLQPQPFMTASGRRRAIFREMPAS